MPLHLLKLCVGIDSPAHLSQSIKRRLAVHGELFHTTRMIPRRQDEVLDGGSLYWVIKGSIQARQKLLEIRPFTDEEGIDRCDLILDATLVPVEPVPRRPFQGWRYLKAEDAPADLSGGASAGDLPAHLRRELRELGVW